MRRERSRHRSPGAVLLVVMACLAIAMTLIVGWTRIALFENRQARSAEDRLQTEWLAESAIQRAAAQLPENSEYPGETWRVTAVDLGRRATAPETEQAAEKSPDAAAEPPAKDKPAGENAGIGEPVLGEVLITVERVPDRPGARRVRVRADFPAAQAAGTRAAVVTNRISKQTVFNLGEPVAK
jgi:type II secretory pathway pseudopilin PulG